MPFADELIGPDTARALFRTVHTAAPSADLSSLDAAAGVLGPLALRARADLLRDALLTGLPGTYVQFAGTIRRAAEDSDFQGWLIWPVTSAVASKAVEEKTSTAFDDGMQLLAELTGRLTSEFAIRTFLRTDLDRALEIALEWTQSSDEHVRRLASEGTRPYLPWSVRVPEILARPGITVPILDRLYRDDSDYVRRSVANHLNDFSRDVPDVVVQAAARWLDDPDANTDQLVRHALRTVIKNGNTDALALLGFAPADLDVTGPVLDVTELPIGGSLEFTASIRNLGLEPAKVVIDYIVHHTKANGAQTGKTFKLKTTSIAPGESIAVRRRHSFRPLTTRKYYPGPHAIELQVNGASSGRAEFLLEGCADSPQ
ncbi:DNA alkylation repair protein [Rhodococcoides yunnanense]|uniref:DNA alkylation repair protein n=1 Tax=Rhodococcoides yunnanense TaxID=278209 RepID=A0ABU4BEQ6_9NOCA|nr:DNA alkylation repair protein [Rhodococcus yunnanensis]MDV6262569.1 DNA alkylation repair protein [Rhodococcus yunnanensis]